MLNFILTVWWINLRRHLGENGCHSWDLKIWSLDTCLVSIIIYLSYLIKILFSKTSNFVVVRHLVIFWMLFNMFDMLDIFSMNSWCLKLLFHWVLINICIFVTIVSILINKRLISHLIVINMLLSPSWFLLIIYRSCIKPDMLTIFWFGCVNHFHFYLI